ncbi:MAG TPA: hypothetical protein PLS66_12745, partial [Tepiditoga sp.]|nr:hypothetical protein [Tepiditoga sp.]
YFLQVAGFYKVWNYVIHEFFHVPDKRSFLGGYFSKRSPNFWLLPLRMFVGYKWLEEGLEKLPKVLDDPSNIFLIPSKVVEAVSSASGTTESAVNTAAAATQWGEALPVPHFIQNIVDWSMNLIFYKPDGHFTGMATVFQTAMVFAELIFGVLLIVGLFSALSSIATVGMGLMIWASGMAPVEMLWYLVGSVALIGGSGSTFGLDYYVLPFLKKRWKKLGWVKKWYFYT